MTTAICIANGPSLNPDDVALCKGHGKIYAVKEAHHLAPFADVLYCADDDWWERFKGVPEFAGERWTVSEHAAKKWSLNHINGSSGIQWGKTPELIAYGGNSGFQAMNLAYVQGATKIILLGFDYKHTENRKHWFDETQYKRQSRVSDYSGWLMRLSVAAKLIDIPVINCSPDSAIHCFRRMNIAEALA